MDNWQIFLFDFDGTLVDSEPLHHLAYKQTCEEYGFSLGKDFASYCALAHQSADSLKVYLHEQFVLVKKQPLDWSSFYLRKKNKVLQLIAETPLSMILGAEIFLQYLLEQKKKIAVVTHSPLAQIELFQEKIPILKKITCWVTRESYQAAKPSPESYFVALQKLGPGKALGFEDSIKGMQALLYAKLDAVMVNAHVSRDKVENALGTCNFSYFSSFIEAKKALLGSKL